MLHRIGVLPTSKETFEERAEQIAYKSIAENGELLCESAKATCELLLCMQI